MIIKETITKAMHALAYTQLRPVQEKTIPTLLSNKQVIVQASTGSGKTLAYLLPILQMIDESSLTSQAMIILPTRELAQQVYNLTKELSIYTYIRSTLCIGGIDPTKQIQRLHQGSHIVIGTTGRLLDLYTQGHIDTKNIKLLVLDEADQILSTGQAEETKDLLLHIHGQMAVFSATISEEVISFMNGEYVEIIQDEKELNTKLTAYYYRTNNKKDTLLTLLPSLNLSSAIVFVKYKDETQELAKLLNANHILSSPFSSFYDEKTRTRILNDFKMGKFRVLVATDAASRGLDLPQISHIIHYDVPDTPSDFIHRSGRSGHQEDTGIVITLLSDNDITSKMGKTILQNYEAFIPSSFTYDLSLPIPKNSKPTIDSTTILLRVGKKEKMRKKDIIGGLCQLLNFEDIGVIDIQDTYTVVTLRYKDLNIISTLTNLTIKGKRVKVEMIKNQSII